MLGLLEIDVWDCCLIYFVSVKFLILLVVGLFSSFVMSIGIYFDNVGIVNVKLIVMSISNIVIDFVVVVVSYGSWGFGGYMISGVMFVGVVGDEVENVDVDLIFVVYM